MDVRTLLERCRSRRGSVLIAMLFAISLAGILAWFPYCGGTGACSEGVDRLEFSPDGRYLAATMWNCRDAQVSMKSYAADVCRTVALIDVSSGRCTTLSQTMALGDQGP